MLSIIEMLIRSYDDSIKIFLSLEDDINAGYGLNKLVRAMLVGGDPETKGRRICSA